MKNYNSGLKHAAIVLTSLSCVSVVVFIMYTQRGAILDFLKPTVGDAVYHLAQDNINLQTKAIRSDIFQLREEFDAVAQYSLEALYSARHLLHSSQSVKLQEWLPQNISDNSATLVGWSKLDPVNLKFKLRNESGSTQTLSSTKFADTNIHYVDVKELTPNTEYTYYLSANINGEIINSDKIKFKTYFFK